ncbi:MAG: glycerate kinase [Leptospiraceae bacterium]|nr:glycerate kinase [Leptospiraceae bacterium]MCP5499356.1 glycerate kinase [Leptospiraceae bacterium]
MNILIASDSFKGSLSSEQFGRIAKEAFLSVSQTFRIEIYPLADGGEGSLDTLLHYRGGEKLSLQVRGPLKNSVVNGNVGVFSDKTTGIVEVASASGFNMIFSERRDILSSSSYGTGEEIKFLLEKGISKILLCLGGSGTNDAGTGILQALGFRFLDKNKNELQILPRDLPDLASIDTTKVNSKFLDCEFHLLCDVTNPLLGEKGASRVYGPQKGASAEEVEILEASLRHYANILKKQTGILLEEIPGTGAAGGIAASLLAFGKAKIVPGLQTILSFSNIIENLASGEIQVLITGEGKLDEQSFYGKASLSLCKLAYENRIKSLCIAGVIDKNFYNKTEPYPNAAFSLTDRPMSLEESIEEAPELLLYKLCIQIAGLLLTLP